MKHKLAFAVLVLAAIGCSKGNDFSGNALGAFIKAPASTQCSGTSSHIETSDFETKGKVLITQNNHGKDNALISAEASASILVPAGTDLTMEVNEKCIEQSRAQGFSSELTESLETAGRDVWVHDLRVAHTISLAELQDLAESDECVRGVENLTHYTTTAMPNDPQAPAQIHLTNIKLSEGSDIFFDPQSGIQDNVVIAIVDSGVDINHADLRAQLWVNPGETAGNGIDDDGNGIVDDVNGANMVDRTGNPSPQPWPAPDAGDEKHGTHVAGLAAAVSDNSVGVAGVNGKKARIMALNVFGATASASNTTIANGIDYAIAKGANVINMSLGGPGTSTTLRNAISRAINVGIVVIVAAGNDTEDINQVVYSPGSYGSEFQGMVTVGATSASAGTMCYFSNFSPIRVELGAPGCSNACTSGSNCAGVLSTLPNASYGRLPGTSMASPIVAGGASLAFGLIKARTGVKPSPALVEEVLLAGSRIESGLTTRFKDGKVLDLKALGDEINRRYPSGSPPPPPPVDPCN